MKKPNRWILGIEEEYHGKGIEVVFNKISNLEKEMHILGTRDLGTLNWQG